MNLIAGESWCTYVLFRLSWPRTKKKKKPAKSRELLVDVVREPIVPWAPALELPLPPERAHRLAWPAST